MSLIGADSATYVSGLQVRTKYNADLLNIVQKFKQATAPTVTEPLMWWFDTASSILKIRNEADTAWISLFYFDGSNNFYLVGPTRIIENSDTITITHDGTDAKITMSDGKLIVQTDEGTNTDTTLAGMGKGTGKFIMEFSDQSATNKVSVTVDDAIGADRTFMWPSTAPAAEKFLKSFDATGKTVWDDPPSGGGGGRSEFPHTLMNFMRSGTSAAPSYMNLSGAGASITMTASAAKTDHWQAQVTNAAATAARFGWDTSQNNCAALVDVYRLRGGKITMGAWVYCTTADRVKLEVSDGTTTTVSAAYHGGGGWEWMTVILAANVAAGATVLTAYVLIEAGAAITVYVELPCVQKGTTCPEHVGYKGGGRKWVAAATVTASGDTAITGCGFSPTSYEVGQNRPDNIKESFGGAVLVGATTTSTTIIAGGVMVGQVWRSTVNDHGTHTSWDSDGVTITNAKADSNHALLVTLHEGNPE